MRFKYKTKISITSLFVNLVILTGFFYLILNWKKFEQVQIPLAVQAYSNNLSLLKEEITDGSTINPNNIYVNDDIPGVIYYVVQPGDTLSKIALNFWVTVKHIKKVNHLDSDIIKPGQKLTITDQQGFVYISKWETAKQIAKKFDLNVSDLLDANSLVNENYKFGKGDEVFIPMTNDQYKKWLAKQRSQVRTITYRYRPVYIRWKHKNIVAKYRYRPNVYNWFYKGQCTRFVAIKKFPYITKNKQKKLWNWNARYWYKNAKLAGYPVWKTPKIWAIVVIKYWGRRYYYAWHVGIVKKIDWENRKLLIEEMNALGKYIVDLRRIPMNSSIIGYIYL